MFALNEDFAIQRGFVTTMENESIRGFRRQLDAPDKQIIWVCRSCFEEFRSRLSFQVNKRNLLPGGQLATAGAHNRARQERSDQQAEPPDQGNPRFAPDAALPRVPQLVMTRRRRVDVNLDELDQIIDRGQRTPLSESEGEKLKTVIHAMAERLLQKRSTEKTSAVLPPETAPAGKPDANESTPAGHGRNPAAAFRGANKVAITHPTLHSGDACPECRRGKLYHQKEPATLVRFVGHAPLEATVFEMERLRCNACGEIFTADEPETAGPAKYDETSVAMIALLKYGTGVPFNRLERLQGQLGMPLPAATQWELMAAAAKPLRLALGELIRQAAQGRVMHNDDTSMRILRLIREPGDKRTGTFTSGIVSLVDAWTIALFFTGWKHAGENIAEVLKQRARELPAPIQMCDALSRNTPKGVETLIANCLAHGRRQVVEVVDHFPEECRYVLETLGGVYHNDAVSQERKLSAGRPAALPSGAQRALNDWTA